MRIKAVYEQLLFDHNREDWTSYQSLGNSCWKPLQSSTYCHSLTQPIQLQNSQPSESVAVFVAKLKKLLEHCGFSEAKLKEKLREYLICGIRNKR